MFNLFQAAEIIGCPPWVLAKQPTFWQEAAFFYRRVLNRVPEIEQSIADQRAQVTS